MRNEGIFLTQTTQPCSWASLNEAGKDLQINKPETENNMGLIRSILDSLNNLYESLSRLGYVMERKNMETNIHREYKG
jgi:hypothetical protein